MPKKKNLKKTKSERVKRIKIRCETFAKADLRKNI